MEKYIKPAMNVVQIKADALLAGSDIKTSDTANDGPFYSPSPTTKSSSVWGDDED